MRGLGRAAFGGSIGFFSVMVSVCPVWKGTQEARFRQSLAKSNRRIFFDGAGMGLFFLHTQLGQEIENDAWLDL
jgi:hypothetical protein